MLINEIEMNKYEWMNEWFLRINVSFLLLILQLLHDEKPINAWSNMQKKSKQHNLCLHKLTSPLQNPFPVYQ